MKVYPWRFVRNLQRRFRGVAARSKAWAHPRGCLACRPHRYDFNNLFHLLEKAKSALAYAGALIVPQPTASVNP